MRKVSNKKVVAVIVTYNRKELLCECIDALLNQDYNNCDILVIDNASTDGTEKELNKYKKNNKFNYFNTGENLGGAGGFNVGIKKAYELGCDFIWVMDDDCIVHKDSLTKLLEADNELDGEYGFLASKVLWKDDSICKMNIPKKTFGKWLKDFDTNYQTIAMSSFVSLFLKAETVRKYGLPIKDFFIWTDDWEYTRRISRENKCYFISNSIVTHKSKENIGASIASVDDRLERFKYLYRNDCVLYRREGIKGKILFKLRVWLHKLRVLKSNKIDKKERIDIINNAIKEGKSFYPKIEYLYKENSSLTTNNLTKKEIDYFESFGYNIFGPIIYEFCLFLKKKLHKKNIHKLFFLSRDGLILKDAFECIDSKIKSEYFYASRRALIVPTLNDIKKSSEIFNRYKFDKHISINTNIKKSGLEDYNLDEYKTKFGLDTNKLFSTTDLKNNIKFKNFIDDIYPLIIKNSKKEYDALIDYSKKKRFDGKLSIVDIGWYGTMQNALKYIFPNDEIHGYYLGLNPYSELFDNNHMNGFLFDAKNNKHLYDIFYNFIHIFEFLTLAHHGSVKRYVINNEVELYDYEYQDTRDPR